MSSRIAIFALIVIMLIPELSNAQDTDSAAVDHRKLNIVLVGTGVAYTGGIIALSEVWYKEKGKSDFSFFNDNAEWNQVDKAGHFYSAYQISSIGRQLFKWANVADKKATIYGAIMSQAFLIPIEILDGFSPEYGFSWGDITANLLGAGFFVTQQLGWKQQKIKPKFSFHQTSYAPLRPELLGDGIFQELVKDYNGQTYWLSFDIYALLKKDNTFPKWLNVAAGYGAEEMLYAMEDENNANGYHSYRQYYLGIDIDLSHIKTRSKSIKTLLYIADMIRLPAPAVEFNGRSGVVFHWLYF